MFQTVRAIVEVCFDLVRLAALFLRPASVIRAENLVLRKQLAAYIERGIKPQRLDHAGRVSFAVLSRLFSVPIGDGGNPSPLGCSDASCSSSGCKSRRWRMPRCHRSYTRQREG